MRHADRAEVRQVPGARGCAPRESARGRLSHARPLCLSAQRVTTVTIFVETNQGEADSTVLSSIKFYGSSVAGTNMSEFKKVG